MLAPFATTIAHHSRATFELDKVTELAGMITEFSWRNPHTFATLATTDASGQPVEWLLELPSVTAMRVFGWEPDTLSVGDEVTVVGNRDRDHGKLFLLSNFVVLEDGTEMLTSPPVGPAFERLSRPPPELVPPGTLPSGPLAAAESIFGTWLKVRSGGSQTLLAGLPGAANLPVTAKGQAAADAFDENENPEFSCTAPTAPGLLERGAMRIERAGDEVRFSHEFMDAEWTAYLNAGEVAVQPSHHGHSVATLEYGVLTVETANFTDHHWGNARGIPSGLQKRVVSRFSLVDDDTRLRYEYTLEDPEYLTEAIVGYQDFIVMPPEEFPEYNCDPVASSRHLTLE